MRLRRMSFMVASLSQTFVDRYGPPTEVTGLRETLRWWGDKTFMSVNKFTSTVGTGMASIGLREYMELAEKRAKERREKAKKDLRIGLASPPPVTDRLGRLLIGTARVCCLEPLC
jgi:hypothetical protein